MRRRAWTVSWMALAALLTACATPGTGMLPDAGPSASDASFVVMVSFDGMRHDMIDRVPTPNFDRVARAGMRADGLIPSYPSKTFPNHYTLATGLYPGHHGLVDNAFYDPRLGAAYRLGDAEAVRDGRWYGGEPIWVTAEKQGTRAASFFWVGTEAEIDGVRPSYFKYYDESIPYDARVDAVLHWLTLPTDERPHLVMLYFDQPDHVAHDERPETPAVDSVVAELDGVLGRLLQGLDDLPIRDRVHLLLMSDHGMAPVPEGQVVYLDDAGDLDGVRVVNNTTQALLYFEDRSRVDTVQDAINEHLEHARAYRPEETPPEWHYRDNPRVGDLVVAADPGWVLRMRDWRAWSGGGTHGWRPSFGAMHGFFMGQGPSIRSGVRLRAFENVHVYPLVAHLLGLEAAPGIDGNLDVLAPALTAPERQ